jgi:hypothetical protein
VRHRIAARAKDAERVVADLSTADAGLRVLDVHEGLALGATLGVCAEHGRILLGERAADCRRTGRIECGHGAE